MIYGFHGLIGTPGHYDPLRRALPDIGLTAPDLDFAGTDFAQITADLRKDLTARGGADVIIGNSIGCVLALELGDLARHLVLSAPPFDYSNAPLSLRPRAVEAYIDTLYDPNCDIEDLARHRDAAVQKTRALLGTRAGLRRIRRLRAISLSFAAHPGLGRHQDKTTCVIGSADFTTPPDAFAAFLQSAAPRARLHIVPDAGHCLPLEAPQALSEITSEAIEGFSLTRICV